MDREYIDLTLLREILFDVRRPAQYIGSEINSVSKKEYDVLISFIFTDMYEVGMSHLGGTLLYNILNNIDYVSCQRSFMPNIDMLEKHKEFQLPIYTLEDKISISSADSIMFSLLYEFNITNALEMLSISNVPLFAKERNGSDPIVIAGGSIMINPKPIGDFFDIIVVGDGEEPGRDLRTSLESIGLAPEFHHHLAQ